MRSKFAILGHPLHPALVAIPIGLFVWTLVADIVYVSTDKDKMWYDISFWTGIAAVATALVAALPGFGDYLTLAVHSRVRGMATAHMILNLTTVALFGVAIALMADEGALRGTDLNTVIALHAVGVGLLSLSGVLGGEMAHRYHLSIVPDDETQAREERARHDLRPGVRAR